MPKRYSRPCRMTSHGYEYESSGESSYPPYRSFASDGHLDVYLSTGFVEAAAYDDLCHELRQMGETDTVTMYINSEGGDMSGGTALILAMRDCPATIKTVLHPFAMSMATLVFLSGDEFEVPTFGQLMLHHYSGGLEGKGPELLAEVTATVGWFECFFREICDGFLSELEIHEVLKGKDLWLQADDILQRLEQLERRADADVRAA